MIDLRQLLDRKGHSIHSVDSEAPVLEALRIMAEHHIGALLVMRGDALAGILSERDYARKVVLLGRSSSETPTWEIMSHPVITIALDSTIEHAMRLMTANRVRHLPVMDGKRVAGVVSIGDLVKTLVEDQKHRIEELENYITHG
jgi:CBS domain-containing protein